MYNTLINLKDGTIYFCNNIYISTETAYNEILKIHGKIDSCFKGKEMYIQSMSFYKREIEKNFYQISLHFEQDKLFMIFVHYENGNLLETDLWKNLKQIKTNKYTKKGDIYKAKNFDWGRLTAFYSQEINLGHLIISYK